MSCVYHDSSIEEEPLPNNCEDRIVSWQEDILPIIEQSCAVSGCHNGISRVDFRSYNSAKSNAADIRDMTKDRSMPFDSTLPQDQIDLIECWVNNGALNN